MRTTLIRILKRRDQALAWLILNVLPAWLGGLVIVSIAAAAISSGETNAATAGTYFVRHVFPLFMKRYPRNPLSAIRWLLICLFILSTFLAVYAGSIVPFVVGFLSLIFSGLAVIVILGRFWPRATWQGAIVALVSSFVVAAVILYWPGLKDKMGDPILWATLAGFIAHVVVSLSTPSQGTVN